MLHDPYHACPLLRQRGLGPLRKATTATHFAGVTNTQRPHALQLLKLCLSTHSPLSFLLHLVAVSIITSSRPIGVGWMDELKLRIEGESGEQMEMALGLPGALILHYDDHELEVDGLYIRMQTKIINHKVWTLKTFLLPPDMATQS